MPITAFCAAECQTSGAGGNGGGSTQVPIPLWALCILAMGLGLLGNRYSHRHGKHLAVLLAVGLGLTLSGLLYSDAAYAPITLHYDANGNISQRTDGSGTTHYTNDALDRLGSEAGPVYTQNLGYDGNGNRSSDGTGGYTYQANSNQLKTTPTQTLISPDAAGNLTGNGVNTYVYNQAGQLAQVKNGATLLAAYVYDYRGRRVEKQLPSGTTIYHYDQAGRLLAESASTGAILRTYIWRDDTPIAQIESSGGTDQVYYLEVDTLNTPRTARDASGAIIWQWYSDAFGGIQPIQDPDGNGVNTTINLRFPGQYYDAESGLVYNGQRYFDPKSGRYLQPDPIGLAGGVNTYTYVGNNPLTRIDPTGLFQVISGGPTPSSYSSFADYLNARTTYMNSPAGQRENMLTNYGASLQDKIKKCDKNKGYLQKKFDNWVVSIDPNINDPLNRHRTAADTSYSDQSTPFNFWFFNSSSEQAQTFYHEFRHLMEANQNLLDNSAYLGSRLSGNGTNEPIEVDADNWASSFIGGNCGC